MQTDFLDHIKQDWKHQKQGKTYDALEIFSMLHRKSKNSTKWLLIISIAEFVIGVGASVLYLIPSSSQYKLYKKAFASDYIYWEAFNVFNLVVSLVFVYFFWMAYKKISNKSSVKKLMQDILGFRRVAHLYILYGFLALLVVCLWFFAGDSNALFFNLLENNKLTAEQKNNFLSYGKYVLIALMFGIFALYYLIVYGILLRKLNKNYKQLVKVTK